MSRPGFRRSSSGGHGVPPGGAGDDGAAPAAPFTQAQILLLMKSEFGRARRHGYPLACVLMRVDRVRELVAEHGPIVRDEIRRVLGAVVAERTRNHDQLGLLRDDRYVLLLPYATAEQAVTVADRVGRAFAERAIEVQGRHLQSTLSMGVVGNSDRDTLFFDTLLSQGELALERAVVAGGGRIEVFRRDPASRVTAGDAPADDGTPAGGPQGGGD